MTSPTRSGRRTCLTIPLLIAGLATSCISSRRPIVLDSTPPGALVYIDGVESGHSTPCAIQLPDKRRTVEFRLDGYESVTREMREGGRSEVIYWREAITDYRTWAFPLWLNPEDLFFPIKTYDGETPNRIHVRMKRAREPLALAR